MIRAAVVEGADLRGELKLMEHVREAFGGAQLEEGEVGEGLVLLLLDGECCGLSGRDEADEGTAAAESSAARSRVFKGLVARIQDLKTNLSALDATSKVRSSFARASSLTLLTAQRRCPLSPRDPLHPEPRTPSPITSTQL